MLRIKENNNKVIFSTAVQALDIGKKELKKLKTSPIVQLETKFRSRFSVVKGKTLIPKEVTMYLISTLPKNEAKRVQEKARFMTVIMAEALQSIGRKL